MCGLETTLAHQIGKWLLYILFLKLVTQTWVHAVEPYLVWTLDDQWETAVTLEK
jgi:hypothetical protein